MNIVKKLPGPLLIFMGAVCLSFWWFDRKNHLREQIYGKFFFGDKLFFAIIVALYLVITYKKNFFKSFYNSGLSGFIGGIFLGIGFAAYVFSMYTTTVANTNFYNYY